MKGNQSQNQSPMLLAQWPRSTREVWRVTLDHHQGQPVFSIRAWYRDSGGAFQPSKDGLTTGVKHLAPLLDGLVEAYHLASASGWLEREG